MRIVDINPEHKRYTPKDINDLLGFKYFSPSESYSWTRRDVFVIPNSANYFYQIFTSNVHSGESVAVLKMRRIGEEHGAFYGRDIDFNAEYFNNHESAIEFVKATESKLGRLIL